jgi:hypothetical protein
MDVPTILLELRQELKDIDRAILSLLSSLSGQQMGREWPRENPFLESLGAAATNTLFRKMMTGEADD